MCGTKNTVNMNHGEVANTTKIIRCNDPHPVIGVRLVSKHRKPMDKCTAMQLVIE